MYTSQTHQYGMDEAPTQTELRLRFKEIENVKNCLIIYGLTKQSIESAKEI